MESKDIVKALECCIKSSHLGECFENKCPLISEKGCKVGKETLYPYALDLIKNQQSEIKKYENIERADDKLIELQQAEIEKLKNSFEAIGIVDIRAKIDIFENYEKQIKELEFINEQKDLIISKLKKENVELEERIKWYSFGRNGHLGHIDTSDLL